ncbi:hypothetical protein GF325_15860 [Candidatus Bathyarchaeota archaeon]|nr:hypothetical protein [Candidatus Bathyarchaeota archaeon]
MSIRENLHDELEKILGKEMIGVSHFPIPLVTAPRDRIFQVLGISEDQFDILVDILERMNSRYPFPVNAFSHFKEIPSREGARHSILATTMIDTVDSLIGGGFRKASIYQFYGASWYHVNMLIYRVILNFLMYQRGSINDMVACIDAHLGFRPEVLHKMSGTTRYLRDILVSKCYSLQHFHILLENFLEIAHETPILILNSILPVSFKLHDDTPIRKHRLILQILEEIRFIADQEGTCIIMVNESSPGSKYPPGGNFLVEYSDYVLQIKQDPVVKRFHDIRLIKGPLVAPGEARVVYSGYSIKSAK